MAIPPEQQARLDIDRLLTAAGWSVQDYRPANIHAARGVALREFELRSGFGTADYLLYVDGKACGIIEAKKRGAMLTAWRSSPASTPKVCWRACVHGCTRCRSSTNRPESKPTSPISEGQSLELLGQSAIFRGYEEPLCFRKTLHRMRAHPDMTTPEFAQVVFRSHVRSGVFRRLGSITTNIGHLTLEKFKAAPFPLPSLEEQHRIVAEVDRRLSIVREVEAEVEANLKRAQALRQAVLAKAFAG